MDKPKNVDPSILNVYHKSFLNLLKYILIVFALTSVDLRSVHAADFSWPEKNSLATQYLIKKHGYNEEISCDFNLNGNIVNGDLKRIRNILENENVGKQYSYRTLCLNSLGGSLSEALKIAKYLQENYINTLLEPDTNCLSACALIFMAGASRGSDFWGAKRNMHVTAELGFHTTSINVGSSTEFLLSKKEVENIYDIAIQSIKSIVDLFLVPEYNRYSIDKNWFMKPSLIRFLTGNDKNNFFKIDTIGKAGNYNIGIFGYQKPKLNLNEKILNICTNQYIWRRDQIPESDKFLDNLEYVTKLDRDDTKIREMIKELNFENSKIVYDNIYSFPLIEGGSGTPDCIVIFGKNKLPLECGVIFEEQFGISRVNVCSDEWMLYESTRTLSDIQN